MGMPADSRLTDPSHDRFDRLLRGVARRWWRRRVAEAVAVAAVLLLLVVIATLVVMAEARFAVATVDSARTFIYLVAPLLLATVLLPRLFRTLPASAAARYVERRVGGLDALLVSATEVATAARVPGAAAGDGSLVAALLQRAIRACGADGAVDRLERRRSRRAVAVLVVALATAALLTAWGPAPWRHGLALLVAPAADPAVGSPFRLAVAPGDAVVIEGNDQAISALPEGFRPVAVELQTRPLAGGEWHSRPMMASPDGGRFEALLFNLSEPLEYRLASGAVVSEPHRLEVTPRPRVSRIDLFYRYPVRTRRPPELVEDGGTIRAVRGSRVEVRIVPDRPVADGELVIDGERRLSLALQEGELRATLELDRDGRYRVELPAGGAGLVAASTEYAIEVHDDDLPRVVLESPGRDTRVTSIEELEIALRAEDDVAVHDVELVLNINGSDEQVVPFPADPAQPLAVSGSHLLALENLSLAPGDMISYYARARDSAGDPARTVTTDIYFMDVRPFEKRFRPAQGGGGGGGGGRGGDQGDAALTAQQRALLVALFKLQRDRAALLDETVNERLATLAEAQARIRDRVEAIVRRVRARSFMAGEEGLRRVIEELPQAAQAMVEVESRLAVPELDQALPPARQALLHMQRADAAFRDVQVTMERSQGGGAGEGSELELANLFRLEMDKFRNQYENLQRGRWNSPNQALDQTLDKLRELARRQQREIERTRLRGRDGRGDPNSQQALAEELEKLIRDLERLTRHRDPQQAAQAQRSLDELRAAQGAMQRAGESGDRRAGEEALERLQSLRQELERTRRGGLARGVDNARERSRQALEEQRAIGERLATDADAPTAIGELFELVERKNNLADGIGSLARDLERLAEQARAEQSAATADLEAAGRTLIDRKLEERVQQSARALGRDPEGYAGLGERELERDLETVQQRLARAGQAIGTDRADDRGAAQERLQSLVRRLQDDQRRLADAANGGAAPGSAGSPGQEAPGGGTPGSAGPGGRFGGGGPVGPAGGGYDGSYGVDFSTIRQQLLERMGTLTALRDEFGALGDLSRDIEAVIAALGRLGDGPTADQLEALRARQAVLLAQVQRLEAGLRDTADPGRESVRARRPVTIAPRFQAQLERYYRNLSDRTVPGGAEQ